MENQGRKVRCVTWMGKEIERSLPHLSAHYCFAPAFLLPVAVAFFVEECLRFAGFGVSVAIPPVALFNSSSRDRTFAASFRFQASATA